MKVSGARSPSCSSPMGGSWQEQQRSGRREIYRRQCTALSPDSRDADAAGAEVWPCTQHCAWRISRPSGMGDDLGLEQETQETQGWSEMGRCAKIYSDTGNRTRVCTVKACHDSHYTISDFHFSFLSSSIHPPYLGLLAPYHWFTATDCYFPAHDSFAGTEYPSSTPHSTYSLSHAISSVCACLCCLCLLCPLLPAVFVASAAFVRPFAIIPSSPGILQLVLCHRHCGLPQQLPTPSAATLRNSPRPDAMLTN